MIIITFQRRLSDFFSKLLFFVLHVSEVGVLHEVKLVDGIRSQVHRIGGQRKLRMVRTEDSGTESDRILRRADEEAGFSRVEHRRRISIRRIKSVLEYDVRFLLMVVETSRVTVQAYLASGFPVPSYKKPDSTLEAHNSEMV